jgi:hypothetical protein
MGRAQPSIVLAAVKVLLASLRSPLDCGTGGLGIRGALRYGTPLGTVGRDPSALHRAGHTGNGG